MRPSKVARKWFFDREEVMRRVPPATRKVLAKMGSFVRTTARRSMRPNRGKKRIYSKPGEPPRARVGLLRKLLFFSFDPQAESVVVGPEALGRRAFVPQLHEEGGTKRVQGKQLRYPPRPYMGPALEKELPKFTPLWRDQIK